MVFNLLLFFAGLLLLYYGAEYLVSGSSQLAMSYGVRPLVVGMTIVAFATSMPELMVSLLAALKGSSSIAAGNIIGSNIANIGLILGGAAILYPLRAGRSVLFRELPYMLLASFVVYWFARDSQLDVVEGIILLFLLFVFLGYCLLTARNMPETAAEIIVEEKVRPARARWTVYIVCGIVGLGVGAELMVRSAVSIALSFGISEVVVGMSVVAVGTSLPELAASLMSAWKGELELSIGNVIGSNIFNLLFVFGVCSIIRPLPIDSALLYCEFPVMLLFSVALWPLMHFGNAIGRAKGVGLLVAYAGFILLVFR